MTLFCWLSESRNLGDPPPPCPIAAGYMYPSDTDRCILFFSDADRCADLISCGWCWCSVEVAGARCGWCWKWLVLCGFGWCWMWLVLDVAGAGSGWCSVDVAGPGCGWCWLVLASAKSDSLTTVLVPEGPPKIPQNDSMEAPRPKHA